MYQVVCVAEMLRKPFVQFRYIILRGWGTIMIEVTKLNGSKILINSDLIETVEETPDTVVTLTTGKKLLVKESRQEVKNLVKSFRREIFAIHNAE